MAKEFFRMIQNFLKSDDFMKFVARLEFFFEILRDIFRRQTKDFLRFSEKHSNIYVSRSENLS